MNSRAVCQQDFNFNLYDDLDVVINADIQVKDYEPGDSPQCADCEVTLNINGTEIKIDGETATQIFKAIECRVVNKIDDMRKEMIASIQDERAHEYFYTKRWEV